MVTIQDKIEMENPKNKVKAAETLIDFLKKVKPPSESSLIDKFLKYLPNKNQTNGIETKNIKINLVFKNQDLSARIGS